MKKFLLLLIIALAGIVAPEIHALPMPAPIPAATLLDPKGREITSVRVVSGGVELAVMAEADTQVKFEVFSITGQMVIAVQLEPGDMRTVDLRKGCYIIRSAAPDSPRPATRRITVQ